MEAKRVDPWLKRHLSHCDHHWAIYERVSTRLWVAVLVSWLCAGASSAVEWVAGRVSPDFAIGMDRWLGPGLVVLAVLTVAGRLRLEHWEEESAKVKTHE